MHTGFTLRRHLDVNLLLISNSITGEEGYFRVPLKFCIDAGDLYVQPIRSHLHFQNYTNDTTFGALDTVFFIEAGHKFLHPVHVRILDLLIGILITA